MYVYLEKFYNSIHFTNYNLVFRSLCQATNKWFVLVPTELNKSHNSKEIISNLCLTLHLPNLCMGDSDTTRARKLSLKPFTRTCMKILMNSIIQLSYTPLYPEFP